MVKTTLQPTPVEADPSPSPPYGHYVTYITMKTSLFSISTSKRRSRSFP
jgi:hypothetical protein